MSERHRRPRRRVSIGRMALVGVCGIVAFWLVAPILVVLPMSFTGEQSFRFPPPSWSTRWYDSFLSDDQWYGALLTSVKVAAIVTVIATVVGTAAALGVVRGSLPGKRLVHGFVLSPMIVPVVVLGVGVYAVFLRWHLTGTTLGFVLAHTALALPFVVVTVGASLQAVDRRLETAAAGLGAGPFVTFRTITLPLIRGGVLTGALFAFITSFDEVVVSLFLVSPGLNTLPVKMYSSVTREVDPTIAAASTIMMVLTTGLLAISVLARQRGRRHAP